MKNDITVSGRPVVIHYDEMGRWQKDLIEIYDPLGSMANSEIATVINYLYAESFILDRRIPVHVVDKEGFARKFEGLK